MATALTDKEIQQSKSDSFMKMIARRASYYRANPHRFCEDYLNIQLKTFQKILLWVMMHHDYFCFIAARGLGKTYLVALFCVCRCILYPGSKVVSCSCTYKQGKEVLLKITDDFMVHSSLLRTEIEKVSTGQQDCFINFKNGSWLKIVTASETSRGARSNIIIVDECRMVPQNIVDTVLRPMNAAPRMPGYLNKPEYAHLAEMNKEFYLSSAWYASSELMDKVKSYVANMLNPALNYFVCDLPYMLSIMEGLLMREAIENEMSEATFSDISFSMEREGKFYGSAADAFFNFQVIKDRRVAKDAMYDADFYRDTGIKPPAKQSTELRVLSADIALLASKKRDNDASAILINRAFKTGTSYISNITGVNTQEGLVTEELGLLIMRNFYQLDMDYLALDCNGVGMGIYDYLIQDRYDPAYGVTYQALTACNNQEMADRCKVKNARKAIFVIKANAKSNNDMALALRAGFQNGNINLLMDEQNIEETLTKSIKGYGKLSDLQKTKAKLPYVQTSFLIDELINLQYDVNNGLIKIKERSGMRKDRYSSLEYNYFVVQQLALKNKPKYEIKSAKSFAHSLPVRGSNAILSDF